MSLGHTARTRLPKFVFPVAFFGLILAGAHTGCGGNGGANLFGDGGVLGTGSSNGSTSSGGSFSSSSSGNSGSSSGSGMVPCPSGLQCNVSCSGSTTTSISGVVYDPAGKDPLYNIAVYVPGGPLQPLPAGVPTGNDACTCGALFKSGMVVQTATGVDGSFKLLNAPVGNVPLVIQVGKWRKQIMVQTQSCQDTPAVAGGQKLTLPGTVPAGDTNTSMPEIAVSTGGADTLECLMLRIGLPPSEYVAGAGGGGHVHLFGGGDPGGGGGGGGGVGQPEHGTLNGLPEADTNLWDSQTHLMPYDITLLSCEGGETYNANPASLEAYLNAGGRAFASHFHYSWFSGPLDTQQNYTAPADWGNALATWMGGATGNQANGKIVQTLNGSGQPFPKGVAFYQWLGLNGALGVLGAPMGELHVNPVRYNSQVGPANKPSQPWVQDDKNAQTLYFSFDTPVNAPPNPDGGAPLYCGRAVFSDLHVGGETQPADQDPMAAGPSPVNAGGCSMADLSPQEKALEFMLFDLSSCVIPDYTPPQTDGGIVQ